MCDDGNYFQMYPDWNIWGAMDVVRSFSADHAADYRSRARRY